MTPTEKIEPLIAEERIEANKNHGEAFASMKEAWAELKEEIEEAESEMNNIGEIFEVLWAYIRLDDCSSRSTLETLREYAIRLIQEAIQVAGICDKALGKPIPNICKKYGIEHTNPEEAVAIVQKLANEHRG